jgi:hypothetical protein
MYDLRFEYVAADELSLPPAGTPELRTARADNPEPATPETSAGTSAAESPAPASDATPGGSS